MPTEKKLWIALLVLAALGGVAYMQHQKQDTDLAAHSLEGAAEALPKIKVSDDDVKKIDKVELTRGGDTDGGVRETIVLVKKGEEDWELEKPRAAKANASNVKSMLDDLKRLEVKELIDPSKDSYGKYKLADDKALHAVFYKGGKDVLLDAMFGEDGSRGQMTRIAGKDGVFAVKGYSSYLFNKDAKGWRDKTILKFEEKDVVKVSLVDEKASFEFEKSGEDWKTKYGKKTPEKEIEKFDKSKLETLVRAYKALSAVDFGDDKKPEDTGLATPAATLTFQMKDGAKHVVLVGSVADGTNRWVKNASAPEIFTISSWAADWAVADVDKFQKADEKKADKDKKPAEAPPHPEIDDG